MSWWLISYDEEDKLYINEYGIDTYWQLPLCGQGGASRLPDSANEAGVVIGKELKSLGINVNLAPVS